MAAWPCMVSPSPMRQPRSTNQNRSFAQVLNESCEIK
ncbi:hypothetical protein A2U01_0094479, partial [Trifolium medium]|nr:hypothetical protein [Trifolium medium]